MLSPAASFRLGAWLILAALGALGLNWLYPESSSLTRAAGLAAAALLVLGIALLAARRWVWLGGWMLALTALGLWLSGPGNPGPREALRAANVEALRGYDGVAYRWGGENSRGIDCSGLVRRGLIGACLRRGLATGNAVLVRHAAWLWWHDASARDLGAGGAQTFVRFEAGSVREIEPNQLLPGDLAVTRDGVHVLAYLGESRWIQADPQAGRVLVLSAKDLQNPWLRVPVRIVRWRVLDSD
ncbi:MAG: C40 family peptidase [Verrucomicrobia bacterium]|nr:C40 family peptidase [Verrucomicrobiota bacterium]